MPGRQVWGEGISIKNEEEEILGTNRKKLASPRGAENCDGTVSRGRGRKMKPQSEAQSQLQKSGGTCAEGTRPALSGVASTTERGRVLRKARDVRVNACPRKGGQEQ